MQKSQKPWKMSTYVIFTLPERLEANINTDC